MDHEGEPEPVGVQIAGADPTALAEAARHNVDHGAQLVDIVIYTLHSRLVTGSQIAF